MNIYWGMEYDVKETQLLKRENIYPDFDKKQDKSTDLFIMRKMG